MESGLEKGYSLPSILARLLWVCIEKITVRTIGRKQGAQAGGNGRNQLRYGTVAGESFSSTVLRRFRSLDMLKREAVGGYN
jgi:hypothetical protein